MNDFYFLYVFCAAGLKKKKKKNRIEKKIGSDYNRQTMLRNKERLS